MVKTNKMKRIITMILIASLIYANLNMAIWGVFSYAQDNQAIITGVLEQEEKKALEIKLSEFSKNDMLEKETNYSETLNLKYKNDDKINEIEIRDIHTKISDGRTQEEQMEEKERPEIETFYKSTQINKSELAKVIGKDGRLEIKYSVKETEKQEGTEKQEDITEEIIFPEINETKEEGKIVLPRIEENEGTIVLPKIEEEKIVLSEIEIEEDNTGIIEALDGIVSITAETQASKEDYITVMYPENTISIEIKIFSDTNDIEHLEIINNKVIPPVENIEDVNSIEVVKQITIKDDEELLNTLEGTNTPINYTKTIAGFGVDKTQIATTITNKINFTITMYTDKETYDLYKNPYFLIELPKEIKEFNIEDMIILNNTAFNLNSVEEGILENGNKAVAIKLEGEQVEHTKSVEENAQIVIRATAKTDELLPTTQSEIKLHYINENVKTYDGLGDKLEGESIVPMNFVANKEIIVESKAIVGENVIVSSKEEDTAITVEPHTYQAATIVGTAINNMGKTIQNVKILGTGSNIGQISGVEKVYYTENENATIDLNDGNNNWQEEYISNAKKYLITLENFEQAQILNFGYYMNLPENIQRDTDHIISFEVYDDNNQLINTSKITINQKAERFDVYNDENIKANIITNTNKVEIGGCIDCVVNVENISERDLEGITFKLSFPEGMKRLLKETTINGEMKDLYVIKTSNVIEIPSLDLKKGETFTMAIRMEAVKSMQSEEVVKANISYEEKQAEIFRKMSIVDKSAIETSITSDRLGQILEAGDEISYKVTLKNKGDAHAKIDISTPQLENIDLTKIEVLNSSTGERRSVSATSLIGYVSNININPEETVEVYIVGIAKELAKQSIATMYVDVTGNKIQNTTTDRLVNTVNKKVEKNAEVITANDKLGNTINGIAWIDKNEDGQKNAEETLLKGVQAVLIDTKNSKVVETTVTNNKGEYNFDNVKDGTYVVEFKYNTEMFNITNYKNEKVSEDLRSSVISTTQNNETTAKTEVVTLEKGNVENLNAGFVINKNFDMSINKGITHVTVNNDKGTNTYDFKNKSMAKVEIDGEYLKGSLILIEYEVAVTNNGEVSGYVKTISDKMPQGMKFNSELNTDWYEGEDGNLYSMAFANKELKPGETATIKLVLTKEMTDDKIVSPVNTATIEETFNEYLIEDKNEENNTSEATIIISLTTGKASDYLWIAFIAIVIIAMGVIGVMRINKNKKV